MKKLSKITGLYAIVDTAFSPQYSHVELAHLVLMGGCKILQLRIKSPQKNWQDVFAAAKKIMELKGEFDFTFIINDFVDVAGEVGADGVHVGEHDEPIAEIRKRLGNNATIGYSAHSIEEALAAERAGADYIAFGAIFPTKTKGAGHPVQGVERLGELCKMIKRPVVAIGGINRSNIKSVISAGADSVAMITGISQAENVVAEVKFYADCFDNSWQ